MQVTDKKIVSVPAVCWGLNILGNAPILLTATENLQRRISKDIWPMKYHEGI